jgi:hypothetical protein
LNRFFFSSLVKKANICLIFFINTKFKMIYLNPIQDEYFAQHHG